jgi:hypothetical protein
LTFYSFFILLTALSSIASENLSSILFYLWAKTKVDRYRLLNILII